MKTLETMRAEVETLAAFADLRRRTATNRKEDFALEYWQSRYEAYTHVLTYVLTDSEED